MLRIFKTKPFLQFMKQEKMDDLTLVEAVKQIEKGLIDADLGSGVIKQRIARPGEGKSGGYRTILLYRAKHRVFFVYGFAKNERSNIGQKELKAFKKLAALMLHYSDLELAKAVKSKELFEVKHHE